MSISTTIAVCTRNRRDVIGYALNALVQIKDSPGSWDVLIVDNDSTDGTGEYLSDYCRAWPLANMRVLSESNVGLSHARNRALRESGSDIVAFIDDDSVVSPNWLSAMRTMFDRHTRAAVVGGPIHVQWTDQEPDWIHPDLMSYFSEVDYGLENCQLHYPRYPYGANFIVRRSIALDVGGFRTDLGYAGTKLVGGEETELARRIEDAGWQVWYCAGASVEHLISGKRASVDWLQRRAYAGGLADTKLRKERVRGFSRFGYLIQDARWLRYAARERRAAVNKSESARNQVRYSHAMGKLVGWLTGGNGAGLHA